MTPRWSGEGMGGEGLRDLVEQAEAKAPPGGEGPDCLPKQSHPGGLHLVGTDFIKFFCAIRKSLCLSQSLELSLE